MQAFEFRLERVLRWRTAELATEEAALKRLNDERVQLQAKILHLRAEFMRAGTSIGALAGLQGADFRNLQAYRIQTSASEKRLQAELARKDQELEKQKRKYTTAKQQCRLLEELRGRKLEVWNYDFNRELEQVAADSFASNAALTARDAEF